MMQEIWCEEVLAEKHYKILKKMLKVYDIRSRRSGDGYEFAIFKEGGSYPVAIVYTHDGKIIVKDREVYDVMKDFGDKFNYRLLIKCWREKEGENE